MLTITRTQIAGAFEDVLEFARTGEARQHNPVLCIDNRGRVSVESGLHSDHVYECDIVDAANWFDGAGPDETGESIVASMTDHELADFFGIDIDELHIED